jgi:hypothetical protein
MLKHHTNAGGQTMSAEQAAYHAAGHLAVARAVGFPVRPASLAEDLRYGVRRYAEPVLMPDIGLDGWTRRKLEGRMMTILAGAEAELRHCGRIEPARAGVDQEDALHLALYVSRGELEEAAALVAWIRLRVANLLRRDDVAADVELLARALLDLGELSREDVEALLGTALDVELA